MANGGSENRRGLLGDLLHAFPKLIPFVLSHHPDCEPYKADVIKIGKLRLCRGCTIAYGIAGTMILLYFLLSDFQDFFDQFPTFGIILVGVVLGIGQILRGIFRKMNVLLKSIVKIFLGLGIGMIIIGVVEIGYSGLINAWIFIGLFVLYGLLGAPIRLYYMKRTCDDCVFKADLENCEGLKVIKELE